MNKFFFLIALVLLILGNVVYGMFFGGGYSLRETVYFGENGDFEHPVQVSELDGGYVIVGKNSMMMVDDEGRLLWEKPVFSYNSMSAAAGRTILVAEAKSGDVFLLDHDGELMHKRYGLGRISRVKVFGDGCAGVLTDRNVAFVYSAKLGKMLEIELPLGTIVDFDYSDENKKLAVIVVDSLLNSYLNVCSVSGEIASGIVMGKDLAYGVKTEKDRIRVVSDTAITVYDYSGRQLDRTDDIGVISRFDLGRSIVGSVENEQERIRSGNLSFRLPERASDAIVLGDAVLIATSDHVELVDTENKVLKEIRSAGDIVGLHSADQRCFAVEYAHKIEFYKMNSR